MRQGRNPIFTTAAVCGVVAVSGLAIIEPTR